MSFGGEAVWALPVMWVLCGLVFLFLCLRLYTRIVCLAAYGLDDHIYLVAFIFLLIFTGCTHAAALYGFGQTPAEINDTQKVIKATLYECIGQAWAIVGMAIAKAALGTFLLRLVSAPWQRVALWVIMSLVAVASIAQVLCFWLACRPIKFVYDRTIEGGYCPIDTRPTSYILCVSTVCADFFFAIFPWIIVYDLQMPRREKLTIAGSFSLGLIAAAAGIKRTVEVEGLYTPEYLRDSVGLIVWSSAEMAITLICIGIPVCRPLYKRIFARMTSSPRSTGYQKQDGQSHDSNGVKLRTIGGGAVDRDGNFIYGTKKSGLEMTTTHGGKDSDSEENASFTNMKIGVDGPFTRTQVGSNGRDYHRENNSTEEILPQGQGQGGSSSSYQDRPGQIKVTETFRIERS